MVTGLSSLCGTYEGCTKVRPGHEDELSSSERKQIERTASIPLTLNADGTFEKQITTGSFVIRHDRIRLTPTHFGGKSLDEMRHAAHRMGRVFGLAFVFNPFELQIVDDRLISCDSDSASMIEFSRTYPGIL